MIISQKESNKRTKKVVLKIIFWVITVATILGLFVMYKNIDITTYDTEVKQTKTRQTISESMSNDFNKLFKNISPSIVGVSKTKNIGDSIFLENSNEKLGLGTGVVIDSDGYILANEHITGPRYSKCYITMQEGRNYEASVIWSDSNYDIAILKINMKDLITASISNNSKLEILQNIYVVSNPVGYDFGLKIVEGKITKEKQILKIENEEKIEYLSNISEINLSNNSNIKEGIIFNEEGELVGVLNNKLNNSYLSYLNNATRIIKKHKEDGDINQAYLGLFAYDEEIANSLGKTEENENKISGIQICSIDSQSPAEKSGLKLGDIIKSVDGIEIKKMEELERYILEKNVGDIITLFLQDEEKIEIVLESKK